MQALGLWVVEPRSTTANCQDPTGRTTRLFFSPDVADINRAKAICMGCPVAQACLDGALARREPCGVWGGQLFDHGRVILSKRPRGRPRRTTLLTLVPDGRGTAKAVPGDAYSDANQDGAGEPLHGWAG
jgi:WhiB family transcriptional regulator, redox-sensing transcriptional regulator